ncbi:N-acetyltransferase 8F1-like [Oculina patagonica]
MREANLLGNSYETKREAKLDRSPVSKRITLMGTLIDYHHRSQLHSHPTAKDAVTIRSFRRSDQAKCQQIFLDGWQEFIRNLTLDVLSRTLWYVTTTTVFASLAAMLWSAEILLLHVSMVFILCALFCIILQISSRQLINYWLKTELNDIGKSYMTEEGSSHMWVAEWSGNVVGMVGLIHKESDGLGTNELKRMYVVSKCRGMGIGSKLLTEVIIYARRQKLDKIVLTTSTKQLPAMRLYRKYGFKQAKGSPDRSVDILGIIKEFGRSVRASGCGKQSEESMYTPLGEVLLKIVSNRICLELSIASAETP